MKQTEIEALKTKLKKQRSKIIADINKRTQIKYDELKCNIERVCVKHKKKLENHIESLIYEIDQKISMRNKKVEKLKAKQEKLNLAIDDLLKEPFHKEMDEFKSEILKRVKSAVQVVDRLKQEQERFASCELKSISGSANKALEASIKRISE